ncbi:hypothetical protein GALMADRAFT_881040 [Galerina marginata CBS 339.88]|uniref:Uncharacterized protein n=1 Tax=Galerina marginata (strain CBS 339.88) TaxID=685588 RepID=A0A067SV78_GALM3|nr:hypothetical protein GALMADRAFT_881040 [Galerina marginata CBS 339.88]
MTKLIGKTKLGGPAHNHVDLANASRTSCSARVSSRRQADTTVELAIIKRVRKARRRIHLKVVAVVASVINTWLQKKTSTPAH